MFCFADESDRLKILSVGWFLNRQPLVLRGWIPSFSFEKDAIDRVPVWIRVMDLELEFWGQSTLISWLGKLVIQFVLIM